MADFFDKDKIIAMALPAFFNKCTTRFIVC